MTNLDSNASQSFKDAAEETFAEKAFHELEYLNKFLGSTTPSQYIDLCNSAHKTIDTYIDRPVEEKEALKALTVFQFGLPFLYDDTRRFQGRYNQILSDMVDDQLQGKTTADILQVSAALGIAAYETALIDLSTPDSRRAISEEQTFEATRAHITEQMEDFSKNKDLISAPRLVARFVELNQKCLELAASDTVEQKPETPAGPAL